MRPLAWCTTLLAVGVLAAPAPGDGPDPRTVIAKADQAARAISAVAYEAHVWGEGLLKDRPHVRATVKAKRAASGPFPLLRLEGTIEASPADKAIIFHLVLGDKQVLSLDEQKKVAMIGDLPESFSLIADAMRALLVGEFLHPAPFGEELTASSPEYEGERTISGAVCHAIRVVYPDGSAIRWYFGKTDFLPHRVDHIFKHPMGEVIRVLELSEIDTAPQFDDATFVTDVPEGFERKEYLQPPRSDPRLLPVGSAAPDWTLKTPAGESVTLSKLRGKVVVLDFWATWCGPCIMAMPHLQKLHERFKDKPVAIIGVNARERSRRVNPAAIMQQKGLTYGLLLDGNAVADAYRVVAIPTLYVIGPDGKVLYTSAGLPPGGEEILGRLIENALESDE